VELSTKQACCKTLSSTVGEKPLTSSKMHPHLEDSRDAHIVGEPWMGEFFCLLFVLLLLSHLWEWAIASHGKGTRPFMEVANVDINHHFTC